MAERDMSNSGSYEKDCPFCGQKVPFLQEWQAVTGQAFIGHRECAEKEAAKFVMVERSMLQEVRDELNRWGWGDMHYGTQAQEQSVLKAVAQLDLVLR